ncbi:Phosphatidylinositol n-acetyglucosaminlytransferase subunit p-related [Thalictrum thalictroides]|uniref:Phosphatidylinositol n-acetyglucosaminlytransferase subunit p-related n=1 Tax=Thalictrum thalictroides TaxID=46969 RepID=A0A7J6UQK9_THATH|nr:Phosphatidylinositol n-acetyglucosaminlytransferase subunit p-related [Thalictrum thalictroides]
MNEIQNRRAHDLEKSFPGCMGRVVSLLDYGPRVTANRLITDKAYADDLVKTTMSPRIQLEEKPIQYEPRRLSSKKKSNGTPMKMLIAHEMSKETECKQKPPNLVAKLMGLDSLPEQHPNSTSLRNQTKGHLQSPLSRPRTPPRYQHPEVGFFDVQNKYGIHPFQDQQEYKDVYEVWKQSPKTSYLEHKSQEKLRCSEKPNERGMDLVREKFIEAKRLATDENLRQSKEFQEALEVLSSNKELFLKFLQEPNSLFSKHLYELESIPSLPHTKRITVLRPSKSLGNNRFVGFEETSQKLMQKQSQVVEADFWDKNKARSNSFSNLKNDNSTHPTRIVVLKPSPGRTHDIKAVASSPNLSPRLHHSKDYFEELEENEAQCSREVAKEITQQMRETLISYPREDTLLSSVMSNGYVGDESSFYKSDNEYIGEGNLSDSEIMTPTSRVSWDYVNKFGSPFSSSFSRASYSPESSVCREAKKRLSERWAMMASNGTGEEQRQVRRSSSTLGEMLALSETKKLSKPSVEGIKEHSVLSSRSCSGEQELREPTSCLLSTDLKDEAGHDSPKNLLRSRSLPVSSTTYGSRLNVELPRSENSRSNVSSEVEKSKSVKSSFKGKVSSLFFSRNKKQNKDKSIAPPLADPQPKSQHVSAEESRDSDQCATLISDDVPKCVTNCSLEEGPSPRPGLSLNKTISLPSTCVEQKRLTIADEAVLSILKSGKARTQSENLDQPSPISVLESPFEDEDTPQISGPHLHHTLQSNLIAKSPPIESLARSLSWDDASELATPIQPNYSLIPSEKDAHECVEFIKTLLSSASLDSREHCNEASARWHSPECPLDPLLLDKFVNLKEDKVLWHDMKRRQQRSNQKLIFDCVNEALVEITKYRSDANLWGRVSSATQDWASIHESVTAEDVWNQIREWFPGGTKCVLSENEDHNSLVVERVVKKEVVGRGWVEQLRLEVDGIGKEIEGKVLEELMEEALFDLTGRFH